MQVPLLRLQCGKIGHESAAARYAAATTPEGFKIDDAKPYAELWMGTHPSLPSKEVETQRTLLEMIQENQALISTEISERYGSQLPFLFKVLSIRKALSIQAHPSKELAEKLHVRDPENYPDDNHKPEMAIALTPFEGLCGFRPLAEIAHFFRAIEPLRTLIGSSSTSEFEKIVQENGNQNEEAADIKKKEALRSVFTRLMNSSQTQINSASRDLVSLAESSPASFGILEGDLRTNPTDPEALAKILKRLNGQFPNDIGLFVFFFLNFVRLEPGEAMFLKADDIHAYISGDIIECMASSDNVVRSGFTPKFRDVNTLTDMLTYSYAPIEEQKLRPVEYDRVSLNTTARSGGSTAMLYDPPIEEFSVVKTDLTCAGAKATFQPIAGPSIFICSHGQGKITVGGTIENMCEGSVFFVGAAVECIIENSGSCERDDGLFTTHKAFCELSTSSL
ncbi:Mannose-6-phosphate isomerase [Penicillium nucicola]|uniref:Mannose-6-phosphate isomerase n=1 Tax=Penicillium nucicola TaxID=1850975 RepID=UPI00254555B9|nr:Mannose-6-phosphate isomerase [Penicillium nucicola]KAJ5757153.1 Mannose-6-phosphate isomerase [Penicillium nucicola]